MSFCIHAKDGQACGVCYPCIVSEVERLKDQNDALNKRLDWTEKAMLDNSDGARAARAEVERLRRHYAESDAALTALTQRMLERDNEVERLRGALRLYGDHGSNCDLEYATSPDGSSCTCGFSAALAGHAPNSPEIPDGSRREKAEAWLRSGPDATGTLAFHESPGESRRALAERVVRAAIEACKGVIDSACAGDIDRDIDPAPIVERVLSEPESGGGASTPRPRSGTP